MEPEMAAKLQIKALSARDGDCLVLRYTDGDNGKYAIVIDGGRASTYSSLAAELKQLGQDGFELELIVLTHIDADHISGLLPLMQNNSPPLVPNDVWYNGYRKTHNGQPLSFKQADKFAEAISQKQYPLNRHFAGLDVVAPDDGPIVAVELSSGLKVWPLSPFASHLTELRAKWKVYLSELNRKENHTVEIPGATSMAMKERRKAPDPTDLDVVGLANKITEVDSEVPNGSSIAILVEWHGRRVLLGGDSHPTTIEDTLLRVEPASPVHLVKASHHGSKNNNTIGLIEAVACSRWLITTDGTTHNHPDPEAIARILVHSPPVKTLYFNYHQKWTSLWDHAGLRNVWQYQPVFVDQSEYIDV